MHKDNPQGPRSAGRNRDTSARPVLHVLHAAEGTKSPIDFTEIQPDKTMMPFFNRGWKHRAESHQCSLGTQGTKRGADRGWEGL